MPTCRGQRAFVTSVRSPEYLPLVQELACSIRKHSPGVPLIVVAVEGDLDAESEEAVRNIAIYRKVEEFSFPNELFARCSAVPDPIAACQFGDNP